MKREEVVEVEIDSELLECVKIAAARLGLRVEEYISQIITEYVKKE